MPDTASAAAPPAGPPRAPIPCPACGALNGVGFTSCVRCARPLGGGAAAATPARMPVRRGPSPGSSWAARLDSTSLPATKLLLGLTLLVFGAQMLAAAGRTGLGDMLLGGNNLDNIRFGAVLVHPAVPGLLAEEPWRLLSAVFVHFGVIHLVMNMAALVHLARLAEPAVGSVRFLLV
ncbi:MAG: rhomboid family intramembrane serine protease [Deltaproteobacteria bacterium]|nr:rhomboid family intramembrane serine protease [Deltaproteobacteria bacterium]